MARHDYVLGHFSKEEMALLTHQEKEFSDSLELWLQTDVVTAMNKYNVRKRGKRKATTLPST